MQRRLANVNPLDYAAGAAPVEPIWLRKASHQAFCARRRRHGELQISDAARRWSAADDHARLTRFVVDWVLNL